MLILKNNPLPFVLLTIFLFSCRNEFPIQEKPVSFIKPWTSVYRQSDIYPNQLMNEEGEYLFILNKTAWAYFACEHPRKVLENTMKHGANLIRVCLEGTPYHNKLNYDLWPWGGTRSNPDFSRLNEEYWNEVETRINMAGEMGIGIDLVLYFSLVPEVKDIPDHKLYWETIINRLSKYTNILTWEIMNEEAGNEAFQDSAGNYLLNNDPFRHPVCSSDGTTDDALWPDKEWMDLAIVHTCTGNQHQYDLGNWYRAIALNTLQHGKPAFNNESGREIRHKNDDPVHRRKQAWLFNNSGCFWTWHSWDGCEGINDTSYFADGYQYLKPMADYYRSHEFWTLKPNFTVVKCPDTSLVLAAMTNQDRTLTLAYFCTRKTGVMVNDSHCLIRIKDGLYTLRFYEPAGLKLIGEAELKSNGLRYPHQVKLPGFTDDLLLEISLKSSAKRTLMEGTL